MSSFLIHQKTSVIFNRWRRFLLGKFGAIFLPARQIASNWSDAQLSTGRMISIKLIFQSQISIFASSTWNVVSPFAIINNITWATGGVMVAVEYSHLFATTIIHAYRKKKTPWQFHGTEYRNFSSLFFSLPSPTVLIFASDFSAKMHPGKLRQRRSKLRKMSLSQSTQR